MEIIITNYVFPIFSAVWLALLIDWIIEHLILHFEKEKQKSELMLTKEQTEKK